MSDIINKDEINKIDGIKEVKMSDNINDVFSEEELDLVKGEEEVIESPYEEEKENEPSEKVIEISKDASVYIKPEESKTVLVEEKLSETPETLSDFLEQQKIKNSKEIQKEIEEEKKAKENIYKDPNKVKDILNMASLSGSKLSELTLIDDNKKAKKAPLIFRGSEPTYQITLNQSAYMAHVEGLKFPDIFSIDSSTESDYESSMRRYQMYYKKINSNSIGISNFADFCNLTSLYDVATIEFGIFNQTFPGKTEFNITCKHCGKTMKNLALSNDYLISVKNENVYEQLNRVISSINTPEKSDEYSLVNKIFRTQLSESKVVVDIRIPTIQNHLDLLAEIRSMNEDPAEIDRFSEFLLFIKSIFIVDIEETYKKGEAVFVEYSSRKDILDAVKGLSLNDAAELNETIEGKDELYRIDYMIRSFECKNCHQEIGDISIDIQDLLFQESVRKLV